MTQDVKILEGIVSEIIYSNEDNGYCVCLVETKDNVITAAGNMPGVAEGELIKISGKFVIHLDYGEQFNAMYYEKTMPKDINNIYRYLASGAIKGIGPATAKKIVDIFGDKSLEIILNFPEKLSEIKGISKTRALEIGEYYATKQGLHNVSAFLQKYGVGAVNAMKIYRRFGSDCLNYIKTNPYSLCNEVEGISFKTADKIAVDLGFEKNNEIRIKAGIKYILFFNSIKSGHTYLPFEDLVYAATNMLEIEIAEAERAIKSLNIEKQTYLDIVAGDDGVFLSTFYKSEKNSAEQLKALSDNSPLLSGERIDELIQKAQEKFKIELAPQQVEAVYQALINSVFIITGGPGTGKTTIINVILYILNKLQTNVSLAAPTGRAAKRLSEVTGCEAKTIHRLLEIGYSDNSHDLQFLRDKNKPLDDDIIIIDEVSMVDILLFNALISALKPSTRLILVGDVDQLPSVGAGNVLADIINSKTIPIIRLTEIFRQASESMIITNAHRINIGDQPLLNNKNSDFFMLERQSASEIVNTIKELCTSRLPISYNLNPMEDIQVLSPMKKGEAGIINLNKCLQNSLNPPCNTKAEKQIGQTVFREGDKVMQIKNNYNMPWSGVKQADGIGVFNGDIGYIKKIDIHNKKIFVLFDDERMVCYDFNQVSELELAYAITVHKSQGNEFKAVVIAVYNAAPMLMKRNLFYTAITRARELVVLVGKRSAMQTMVDNNLNINRFTALKKFLCE